MKASVVIVIFVYNRLSHTQRVLEALRANVGIEESELFVFCDGARDNSTIESVSEVRKIIRAIDWVKSKRVFESEENKGIERSVIDGLNLVFSIYDKAIILEDDIVCSKGFLSFMNQALDCYEHESNVAGISGYAFSNPIEMPDSYFLPLGSGWGWGTWKRVWERTIFDGSLLQKKIKEVGEEKFNFGHYPYSDLLKPQEAGKLIPWDVCFYASYFLEGGVFLFPKNSLVENIGFDGSGTHSDAPESIRVVKLSDSVKFEPIPVKLDPKIVRQVEKYFEMDFKPSFLGVLRTKFLRFLNARIGGQR
jgi:hypothetical protein